MDLASKLLALRQQAGMTQAEVAAASGLSDAAVSRLETGEREPEVSSLQALGKAFGVTFLVTPDAVKVRTAKGREPRGILPPPPPRRVAKPTGRVAT